MEFCIIYAAVDKTAVSVTMPLVHTEQKRTATDNTVPCTKHTATVKISN